MTTLQFLSHLRGLNVKLWLDGEKLRYSAPAGTLTPDLLKLMSERKAELADFLRGADQAVRAASGMVHPVARHAPLPLSFAQQRLWVFDSLNPLSAAYNLAGAIRLRGHLNRAALKRSFEEIVRRHEVLRTTFVVLDWEPVQIIAESADLSLPLIDLHSLRADEREAEAKRLATKEAQSPFDLSAGPLLRLTLLQLDEDEHLLLLNMHHIISDGWSIGVMVREFSLLYPAFNAGRDSPLPTLPVQYADFAVWQRNRMQGEFLDRQLSYWKRQLGGHLPTLELPTTRPRPAAQTFHGARERLRLSADLTGALKALCQRADVTLFMLLLAVFKLLLHRYTGQDDFAVGTTIANRNRVEIEPLIGFFVNTLALRTDLSGDPTFIELMRRVRDVSLSAYAHQDMPFEKLVNELQLERDPARSPLFQVMFVLQNAPTQTLRLPGLSLESIFIENWTSKFDLTLELTESEQGLEAVLEYNTDLFDGQMVVDMLRHFQALAESVVDNPLLPISQIPLIKEQERRMLLTEWAGKRSASYPPRESLIQLFEAQVERTPDAPALFFEDERLTYAELNRRANRLAHRLRRMGVEREMLVGIWMERSVEVVVAILGVLKAGGAYVPMDPMYPPPRLAFMLEDAEVTVLLTQQSLRERVPPCAARLLCLDGEQHENGSKEDSSSEQNPGLDIPPENLAYVIYTSGSTGKPKGTLVSHGNVVRLFQATEEWFGFNESDVWTLFHSYAFDFSVWEIWGALLYGGRLVIVPHLTSRSPDAFYQLLSREQVTVLNQTPSAFRQLVGLEEALDLPFRLNLRLVIFGGEALEPQSLRPWFDRHGDREPQLVNMYGITETTVHVTYRPLCAADADRTGRGFIGGPIPDLEVYLLDRHLEPVPVGVPGEIYVGGSGLARGYLKRAELTAERFVPHPFSARPGERLYKSGDAGRYAPDGDIEYLGRIDQQVKVRGFRIEPGEIEAVLAQHAAVREAVVMVRDEGGEKHLVAYLVRRGEESLNVSRLRDFLKQRLPEYMVPASFVYLDALPLTTHGKVDRKALPAPASERPLMEKVYAAPQTPVEEVLAGIWEEVLRLERVGLDDNFFDLGGDSIRAIQLHARARAAGLDFSLQQIFRHSTVRELAQTVSSHTARPAREQEEAAAAAMASSRLISEADRRRLPEDVEDAYPLSALQAGMFFHSQMEPDSAVYHNVSSVHLKAPFAAESWRAALRELATNHPVLRTSFDLVSFEEPLQLVHRDVTIPLKITDLRRLELAEQEAAIDEWFEAEKRLGFEWTRAPLMRFHIHLRSEQTFQLSWTEHHAILDGWSVASMITELFQLYFSNLKTAGSTPEPEKLPPPPRATFRDFVALERSELASEEAHGFWSGKLSELNVISLPRQSSRRPSPEIKQGSLKLPLAHDISEGLKQLARAARTPLKSVLLAAHLRVLSVLGGQSEVVTGMILNGRPEEADGDRVLGLFLNTLPLGLRLDGGSWTELVRETFEAEQEIFPFRRYPLARLQQLNGGRSLFETTFNFINFHIYQNLSQLEEVEFREVRFFADTHFALRATFSLDLISQEVQLELGYLLSDFTEQQSEAIGHYYATTLAEMVQNPSGDYTQAPLLSQEERRRLLTEWSETESMEATDACLHQLFDRQAERTPEAVAVVFEEQSLTYRELAERVERLAYRLRLAGVRAETLVGIYAQRSVETVTCALAVLKAGGAYLPLDTQQPPERLRLLLEETRVSVVLAQDELADRLPRELIPKIISPADAPGDTEQNAQRLEPIALAADNLAYVLYTSGSTGAPKGVMVPHRSLVNYVRAISRRLRLTEGFSFAMLQPLTVDACLTALYPPLITGGSVHVISQERATDPRLLSEYLERQEIDCLKLAPSHLMALQSWHQPERLMPRRWLIIGGEAPRHEWVAQLQELAPSCRILNQYGPTETTVAALAYEFEPGRAPDGSLLLPTGRPLANMQVYLLDRHLQPVPPGVIGEVYIGGAGLARGYLHHPALTAERFIPDPFSVRPGARLYRTGDLARFLSDGNVIFHGRADDQVKIRGFRVEPGEVAAVLGQHPGVRESAVLAREDVEGEDRALVAYVVMETQNGMQAEQLRAFLQQRLPEYMVPSAISMLDNMPRTPHGKLDRRALPAPERRLRVAAESFTPPRDLLELQLIQIWESILKTSPIGIRDNFFDLGGSSISAMHLMAHVQNRLGKSFPLARLLQNATVEHLATLLQEKEEEEEVVNAHPSTLVGIQTNGTKRPFFCVHPVGGNVLSYFLLSHHLGPEQPFYGLQAAGLNDERAPLRSIEDMAAHYLEAVFSIQPHGPYLLGGWSMGGVVALEMAQQLKRRGEQVARLVLIDSLSPALNGEPRDDNAAEESALLVRFILDLGGLYGKESPIAFEALRGWDGDSLLNDLLERAKSEGLLSAHTDLSQLNRLVEVFKSNRQALRAYAPLSYDGDVLLLRASEAGAEARAAQDDLGWSRLFNHLEVRKVPGDHYGIIARPHVEVLAEQLKAYLDGAALEEMRSDENRRFGRFD